MQAPEPAQDTKVERGNDRQGDSGKYDTQTDLNFYKKILALELTAHKKDIVSQNVTHVIFMRLRLFWTYSQFSLLNTVWACVLLRLKPVSPSPL